MPNYSKHNELTPKQYIEKVKRKEIHDPVLNFQISNDFHPVRILKGYLEGDTASNEYAVLMEWDNIYYTKPNKKASTVKKSLDLGSYNGKWDPIKLRWTNATSRIFYR